MLLQGSTLRMNLLFLLLFIPLWSVSGEQMPRFVYSQSAKLLLVWNNVWEAGTQNSMVFLSKNSKITLRVRVDGVAAGSGLKRTLLCSCPTKSSVDSVDMASLSATPTTLCNTDISFTLKTTSVNDEFELTMGSSSINYASVFSSKVILTVKVEYSGGVLMSNTLSMWNLDPISDFPESSSTPAGYERHFLTEASISLMTRMDLGTGDFHNISFLDDRMVTAVQSAPRFFQQKLNLGAILYFDASGCSSPQAERSYQFTTYDPKVTNTQMTRMKTMLLDRTGILWYARCQLYKAVTQFYQDRGSPSQIGICLSVSFSGNTVPYQKISPVKGRIGSSEFSYSTCSDPLSSVCSLVSGTQQNVTIYSGMENTQLVCPIVCVDPTSGFAFYRNGVQLIPPTSSDWSVFGVQGVRIARTSNIIEFSKDISSSHSGVYMCSAGGVSFTYYVSVVAMPTFSALIGGQSAILPPKVLAMQGESLSYSCGVTYSGLGSPVSLQPKFFLPSVSGGVVSWTERSLKRFNSDVSPSGSSAVSISMPSAGSGVQLMNVSIESVPPQHPSFGYNFTHRFVCSATVSGTDAADLGMSSYGAQSGGDVVYVSRPTKDSFVLGSNNDCVTQKCHLGKGATFQFALSPQYSAYLSDIGVDVDLFLRMDNLLLSDMILMSANVSVINSTGTSISYEILPITNEAVRTELQKRSTLTPVYNFRYRAASEMGNVNILKSRYGTPVVALGSKDCRTDPLCFYSTDFDVSDSLSFLSVKLDFDIPHDPHSSLSTTNLAIMIAGIVCALIIIAFVVFMVYIVKRSYSFEKELQQMNNINAPNGEELQVHVRQSPKPSQNQVPVDEGGYLQARSTVYEYDDSRYLYDDINQNNAMEYETIQKEQTDQV